MTNVRGRFQFSNLFQHRGQLLRVIQIDGFRRFLFCGVDVRIFGQTHILIVMKTLE